MVAIASAHPSLAVETSVFRSDEIRRALLASDPPPLKTTDVAVYQAEMLKKHNGLRFEFGGWNRLAVALVIITAYIFAASLGGLVLAVLLRLVFPLGPAMTWLAVICLTSLASSVILGLACDSTEQPSNIYLERSYWTRDDVGAVSIPYWIYERMNTLQQLFPDLRFKVDHLQINRKQLLPDPLLLAILPDDSIVYLDGWNPERDIERES